jgi:hypothetical protein
LKPIFHLAKPRLIHGRAAGRLVLNILASVSQWEPALTKTTTGLFGLRIAITALFF